MIRGLALGQVKTGDALKVMFKELQISLTVGAVLSLINIVRVYLMNDSLLLAITVGISMFMTVVKAKLIGSLLPLLAEKLRLDPAIMGIACNNHSVDEMPALLLAFISVWPGIILHI